MASGSGGQGRSSELPPGLIDRKGTPTGKATRFPSLRGPRDLTLGGAPRKVFTPNIPVPKDRSKPKSTATLVKEEGRGKPPDRPRERGGRGRDGWQGGRGRGRGRGYEDNFVQMPGVFDQGLLREPRKSSSTGGLGGGGGGGGGGGSTSSQIKRERKNEEDLLKLVLRDDFISNSGDHDTDQHLRPVTMPLNAIRKVRVKKADMDLPEVAKPETEPLKEEGEGRQLSVAIDEEAALVDAADEHLDLDSDFDDDTSCAELLEAAIKSEKPELVFVQLPAELPGISNEESRVDPSQPGTSKPDPPDSKKKAPRCSLGDFEEGYLGKMRVRKSGKVELVLGDTVLDVSLGVPAAFLQEVVSIRTEEDDKRMTVLGHVQHKMVITPNYESLLMAKGSEHS